MTVPGLRGAVMLMSALAVLSDAVLIGFYPQFFATRYGITSSLHVGAYLAAISIVVMAALPCWARLARRVQTLPLLLCTQGAAGLLCLGSAQAGSVAGFWGLSLLMFAFKSSYLLSFPYLMRLAPMDQHRRLIAQWSVLAHAGAIAGAASGGWLLQALGPQACLMVMAAGDFGQMVVCALLIHRGGAALRVAPEAPARAGPDPMRPGLWLLCLLMLLFDFSAYLVRPFFTVYWEQVSGLGHAGVTGAVFAIPAAMALLALWRSPRGDSTQAMLWLGGLGLLLQALPSPAALLLGRCLYGWALFQVVVTLEASLFRLSTPQRYARDFSLTYMFQNLGVLLSSLAAGAWVQQLGMPALFLIAAAGWGLTALVDRLSLRVDRLPIPAGAQHAH